MTGIIIAAAVVLLFVLYSLLPVCAEASWNGTFFARVTLGRRVLWKWKQRSRASEPVVRMIQRRLWDFLPRILRRARVRQLCIHVTAGGPDPAEAAGVYMAAGTALEELQNAAQSSVKRLDLLADIDFDAPRTAVDARIELYGPVWKLRLLQAQFLCGFLKEYFAYKRKGATENGRPADQ